MNKCPPTPKQFRMRVAHALQFVHQNSGANIAGFSSATANLLVSTMYSGDDAKFAACYRAMENLLAADAFMLPVWDESTYFVCTKGVKGIDYRGGDKIYFGSAEKF